MLKRLSVIRFSGRNLRYTSNFDALKASAPKKLVVEELSDRDVIKVEGHEAVPFLQGLITNDMNHIIDARFTGHGVPAMFAMFLNKGGRVLYDTIIYRAHTPYTFLIECDKGVSSELRRHLRVYRVRRKINVEEMDKVFKPWVIFDPDGETSSISIAKRLKADAIFAPDPRVRGLGWRLFTDTERSWGDVARLISITGEVAPQPPSTNCNYRYQRYCFGVGEGIADLPPGKCIPLEVNGDFLHGISFQKGCYIGQELTARAYHTGIVRKRLMPLVLTAAVPQNINTIQTESFANVGTLRGICKDRGLALLRVEQVLKSPKLLIDGEPCYVEKPEWWPKELPSKLSLLEKA